MIIFLSACGTFHATRDTLPTAQSVDIQKYMGDWYIIANIPTFLETNATNAMESYSWNAKDGLIDIGYRHRNNSPRGELTSYLQKAWVHDKSTNAEWKVRPLWPLKFDYLILDIAPDYSYTLVGEPNRDYVWILSRRPELSESTYAMLVEKAKDMGFDTSKLRKVPQIW